MQRMQVRPLMASLLALLGLWMALRPLPDAAVSLLIALAGQEDISSSVLMAQFVHFFSNSLIGLSLILWREALSRWLVPQGSGVLVSPRACMAVGTALMGIYFIAAGFRHMSLIYDHYGQYISTIIIQIQQKNAALSDLFFLRYDFLYI